jgi:predicted transcriptional regulator
MRQKYMIIHDAAKKNLKIREYAIIDKSLKNTQTSMLRHTDYCLLYEEIYDSAIIVRSISNGMSDLIATLRTPNLFPIAPTAAKIAQSVISLYDSGKNSSVELFFNDID